MAASRSLSSTPGAVRQRGDGPGDVRVAHGGAVAAGRARGGAVGALPVRAGNGLRMAGHGAGAADLGAEDLRAGLPAAGGDRDGLLARFAVLGTLGDRGDLARHHASARGGGARGRRVGTARRAARLAVVAAVHPGPAHCAVAFDCAIAAGRVGDRLRGQLGGLGGGLACLLAPRRRRRRRSCAVLRSRPGGRRPVRPARRAARPRRPAAAPARRALFCCSATMSATTWPDPAVELVCAWQPDWPLAQLALVVEPAAGGPRAPLPRRSSPSARHCPRPTCARCPNTDGGCRRSPASRRPSSSWRRPAPSGHRSSRTSPARSAPAGSPAAAGVPSCCCSAGGLLGVTGGAGGHGGVRGRPGLHQRRDDVGVRAGGGAGVGDRLAHPAGDALTRALAARATRVRRDRGVGRGGRARHLPVARPPRPRRSARHPRPRPPTGRRSAGRC